MKSFEFVYGATWYKYENGRINKKNCFGSYDYFCPVHVDIHNQLKDLSIDQCKSIMKAILHGYICGIAEGKQEKIKEFKRVLQID